MDKTKLLNTMLYKRDYFQLTQEENIQLEKAEKYYCSLGKVQNFLSTIKYRDMLPIAASYNRSYFPNNYLDFNILKNQKLLKKIKTDFCKKLDANCSERDILNYLNLKGSYNFLLISSLFLHAFTFGHHDAYLFKEFELSASYKSDYLLIGKNSQGYNFIFVELESINGQIINQDGSYGTILRKGIKQIEDWDYWLEANFSTLNLIFTKYKNKNKELPEEFHYLDKTRLNYVIIAGRRKDYNKVAYRQIRKDSKSKGIYILHYDNIIDCFDKLMKYKSF